MRNVDRALYVIFAGVFTLAVARVFYGYMLVQTGGEWSAPLDDVFIHFDYARATARGYPFQWSAGNGYSSGNTSLLYPFVLAAGYLSGFRDQDLMIWAGIVACVAVFGLLLAAQGMFASLRPWAKYLAPPALFAVGALDWSLFSGMEVALYLGIWAGAFHAAWSRLAEPDGALSDNREASSSLARAHRIFRDWELGLWGLLLVVTRPEGATSIAALGLLVAHATWRKAGVAPALRVLARAGLPAVIVLFAQAITNRVLTGEFSASGAIVKLTIFNPYMTAREKFEEYLFLLKYVIFRNTEYHFTDAQPYGYLVTALAAVPLFFQRTRAVAIALWGSIIGWLLLVSMNAQVRWQNERYTMPAVAWVLLLAALGAALLLDPPPRPWPLGSRSARAWVLSLRARYFGGAFVTVVAIALFVIHQRAKMRDQIWFFGRACRNIRDQHIIAGRILKQLSPQPKRVLVGDAGALLYASDLPGVDLIGLGGFHDLPFARAGVTGLGATLELLERVVPAERPDVFAIYPSWWGDLPSWFGRRIIGVPVYGNVICGGAEKVLYRADWHALGNSELPRSLRPEERVVDEFDAADLLSEREHDYEFPHPSAGFVETRVLPDTGDTRRDMFDAGRIIPGGREEHFRLALGNHQHLRLVARSVPDHEVNVDVDIGGKRAGTWHFTRADGWSETSFDLMGFQGNVNVTVTPRDGTWVDHHIWAIGAP